MSNLAFCAAPIENINQSEIKQNKRGRNPSRRRKNNITMKHRNLNVQRNPKNIIDEIHNNLNTDIGEDSNLMNFQPISPPQINYEHEYEHDPNKTLKRPRTPTRETVARSGEPGNTHGGPVAASHYPTLDYAEPEAYLEDFNNNNNNNNIHPILKKRTPCSKRGTTNEEQISQQPQTKHLNDADRDELLRKLNYMIQLLEENHDERTGHVTEEVLLYSFLGIFIIFVVDSFARVGKYIR